MNIREAKEELRRSVEIYLEKNEFGEYAVPYGKQRPVFMIGAPGIGKTAIVEQIAWELDVALVSYSMTHHTRQSALGLPFIQEKEFDGKTYSVSEYTMSEILSSVYVVMEESGKREGILFLDEINCVSETLAPAMLLFLQYKVFGNRRLPEGWVIITAGNPARYNRAVREFDLATLDRLKCFSIEEDFSVWKSYAYQNGIHGAVMNFLEINPEWFYSIRTTVEGTEYVTARGWEDLSRAMTAYEKKGFPVDGRLIGQYVTHREIAGKFGIYYDLFRKYKTVYRVEDILQGRREEEPEQRAMEAGFDERVSLLGMLLEGLNPAFTRDVHQEAVLERVVRVLRQVKGQAKRAAEKDEAALLCRLLEASRGELQAEQDRREAANSLGPGQRREYRDVLGLLEEYGRECGEGNGTPFQRIKKAFDKSVKAHRRQTGETRRFLENAFGFLERIWGRGQELVLFMTELTANEKSMRFLELWGCDAYFRLNQELLIYDVRSRLRREIAALDMTAD